MDMSNDRMGKLRVAAVLVIGAVMGANLLQPAVAHVTRSLRHLTKHLDPRYVNVGEKASDADRLDGKDSTEFLGATAKASDADRLDGRDSASFADSDDLLWAVVDSTGALIRGRGVLQTFQFTPGINDGAYEIVFVRNDIQSCSYTASPFDETAGRGNQAPAGEVGIIPLSTSPANGLAVQTHNSAGTGVDMDWTILVLC
jgi:hypothetical protein